MTAQVQDDTSFGSEDMLAHNMADMVNRCVAEHGAKPAFSCALPTGHAHTLTFDEIGKYSDAVAAYLREEIGLVPGDVVAIQSPNVLAYPVLAFGVFKAGLTITNINPLYTPAETNHQLKDSGAKIWFVIDVFGDRIAQSTEGTEIQAIYKVSLVDFFPPLLRNLLGFAMRYVKKVVPPFEGDCAGDMAQVIKAGLQHLKAGADLASYTADLKLEDAAIFQYTGGTTGRSKGALLTHGNVVSNISQTNKREDGSEELDGSTMMLILPLYHVYALAVGALNSMYRGWHVVLVPAPRPLVNLKPVFNKFDIALLPGVNTLYLGLMKEKWFTDNPPQNLKLCFSGAAPLQPATADAWKELTGAEIYEGYGLTEGTCVISTMPFDLPPKRGTCGIPIPGTQIRIVDEDGKEVPTGEAGELLLKGPQIMKGYLNNTLANGDTFVDGWLKTGDVGVMDDEGYLSIVDRIKDMVIVSGFNVYPTDIEDVLTRHEHVSDAAVIGAPDDNTGERVVAYVVAKGDGLSAESVIAHCKEHLTNYKVPKTVHFVDELPKSPVGKILRRELREKAEGRSTAN
jgi:long-chain acyl-CoA synthetase